MRILLYIVVLALLFFAPLERLDIAHLEPVQTLAVRINGDIVELETDTGNSGQGKTVAEAVKSMEENTAGVIYLDTAQYLLLTESASSVIEELGEYLHSGTYVCMWDGEGSVAGAAQYLEVRDDLPKFRQMWTKVAIKGTGKNN